MKKKDVTLETYVALIIFILVFSYFSSVMGLSNFLQTMMATAYDLLINTVFFIMAIAVLASAISGIFTEFGIVALLNHLISPFTTWFYHLPGVSSLGAISTYLSDNPAIISLVKDKEFKKYFEEYQLPVLCNLGTSFGMGLILTTYIIGLDISLARAAIVGNIAAVVGSWFSVRLMLRSMKKHYKVETEHIKQNYIMERETRSGSPISRLTEAVLDGGKEGVLIGFDIIPGVLIISTVIMLLTFGPSAEGYTGAAYEGVGLLTGIGNIISFLVKPILGFKHPEAIAFPLTSLGSTGAAMALIPNFIENGIISAKDIAVYVAMGMTWSGYLSTHIGMMDALGSRKLAPKAILSHTVGGLMAGIAANYLYQLTNLF